MTTATAKPREGAQAVHRTLALLRAFGDSPEDLPASDLARRLGLALSTTHRLLQAMTSTGFLEQDTDTARYRLGPTVAELGRAAYYRRGLHRAEPELADLSRRTGVVADLAVRVGAHAVILVGGSLEGDNRRTLRRPLHSTALGKVLLAWSDLTDEQIAALSPLTAQTDRTITDPRTLRDELTTVRATGFALNDGESASGVRSIAVPVLDTDNHARFALALRSSPDILIDTRLDWFTEQAAACAAALEVVLLSPAQRRSAPRLPLTPH
ncbi:DNA-binding transcriptional repressor XynR [Nocardia sp. JMUB6875]|uniref:IclR family transcriptional regulator n=1 Tax=Nocardia sp. JMUB6875 TaxID=3158170 RepID=UPI0032E600CD